MVFTDTIHIIGEFIWSERLFLVSLVTLIAVVSLNWMAYQYKKKKEEPAHFKLDKSYLQDNGYALSIRFQNMGDGECQEFKIINVGYYVGPEKRELARLSEPYVENYIDPGEYAETTIAPSPGFVEHRDEKRIFAIDYKADGVKDRITIMPDELENDHWMLSE